MKIALIIYQQCWKNLKHIKRPTINRAEIMAAIMVVRQVVKMDGVKALRIHSDSEYMIKGINEWI